jgi:hypothetical protein
VLGGELRLVGDEASAFEASFVLAVKVRTFFAYGNPSVAFLESGDNGLMSNCRLSDAPHCADGINCNRHRLRASHSCEFGYFANVFQLTRVWIGQRRDGAKSFMAQTDIRTRTSVAILHRNVTVTGPDTGSGNVPPPGTTFVHPRAG